nr:MAG TPA: helix-turn-helix domain protein [Caudoviricetes sp.]
MEVRKLKDRFKELRETLSLTQQKFADRLNISRNFVAQIEMGSKIPSDRTIKDICREFKVNYDWLVNGTGDMFQDDDSDAQAIVDSVMTGDNDFAKKTLVKFARLSEERWRQLQEILEELEKN